MQRLVPPAAYTYVQLGCTKEAEVAMLRYARTCIGKPFSNIGMARSILWPRQTDESTFFCAGVCHSLDRLVETRPIDHCRVFLYAELIAAVLQRGGLMSQSSNPGAATPESLHQLYSKRGAVTANPFLLRSAQTAQALTIDSIRMAPSGSSGPQQSQAALCAEHQALMIQKAIEGASTAKKIGNLRVVAARREAAPPPPAQGEMRITLNSLDMRQR